MKSTRDATNPKQRALIGWLALLWIVVPLARAGAQQSVRLRVLSYNIHHAEGTDRKLDIRRIADVISAVEPDLVALQEVDRNAKRTKSVDQPAELARLTKMHVVFGANIPLQGGHYGNAVLSRFAFLRHANHPLPNFDDSEQRGVLEVEVQLPGTGETLLLFATHLDHRRDDRQRIASAREIRALVAGHADRPALLAGDLNDVIGSETISLFDASWKRVNDRPLPTVPVGQPGRQIDFVLYRPDDRWKVVEVKVLDEAIASDHRAILAVLELLPAN